MQSRLTCFGRRLADPELAHRNSSPVLPPGQSAKANSRFRDASRSFAAEKARQSEAANSPKPICRKRR